MHIVKGREIVDVITVGETYNIVLAYCLLKKKELGLDGVVLDLTDISVYVTAPSREFWELVRNPYIAKIYLPNEDKNEICLVGNSIGLGQIIKEKLVFSAEKTVEFKPELYVKETDNEYIIKTKDLIASELVTPQDITNLGIIISSLEENFDDKPIILDLRHFILKSVIEYLTDFVDSERVKLYVDTVYINELLETSKKEPIYEELVGKIGVLNYTPKMAKSKGRGYCLPAKITNITDTNVEFEIFSPLQENGRNYKYLTEKIAKKLLCVDLSNCAKSQYRFITTDFIKEDEILHTLTSVFG